MRLSRGPAAPPCLGAPLSSSPLHQSQKGWCRSVGVPGTPPQNSLPQFPQCTHRREMGHARALHAHVCANTPGAVRVLCVHTCRRACPHQPQRQQRHGHIVPICRSICHHAHTHTGLFMCVQAPLPWVPAPTGPLAGGPLAAPRAGATLPGGCVHTHMLTHVCVLRRVITHPAAVGKAPPGQGLPRRSCWVTARPNDAMSSFAYAKQHQCCRVPREEALPPAPRDPLGCPGMPTHLPCTYPPPCPGLHGFINSNHPH